MNIEFLEALEEMARERGIDREAAYEAMEKGLAAAYQAEFGGSQPPEVRIDRRSGDIYINGQKFELSKLGRIATRRAEEYFRREILRRRREALYAMYASKVGEIVHGQVHRFEGRDVWIHLGDLEALMPAEERIPNERYAPGSRIRAYLYKVEFKGERAQGDPRVYLSRAHPGLLAKLLTLEVPELEQGMMEIVKVVRVPGVRAKVLVRGLDPRIDPVGSCIGPGGSRIRAVSRELAGEKIDVIKFSEDVREVIRAALAPASVREVELDEAHSRAIVVVPEHEVSLAIGRDGHNVGLAARLTGYDLTVRPPSPGEESKRS